MKVILSLFLIVFLMSEIVIFDFSEKTSVKRWYLTNDDVMGGMSTSKIGLNNQGNGVFSGTVSTNNNGGFAMARLSLNVKNVSRYTKIILRVKGDDKLYQLRLKSEYYQRYWYVKSFKTLKEWQIIELPLKDFYPSFRGYKLNKNNFDSDDIRELAILIGNKRNENFKLEIDWIKLR